MLVLGWCDALYGKLGTWTTVRKTRNMDNDDPSSIKRMALIWQCRSTAPETRLDTSSAASMRGVRSGSFGLICPFTITGLLCVGLPSVYRHRFLPSLELRLEKYIPSISLGIPAAMLANKIHVRLPPKKSSKRIKRSTEKIQLDDRSRAYQRGGKEHFACVLRKTMLSRPQQECLCLAVYVQAASRAGAWS